MKKCIKKLKKISIIILVLFIFCIIVVLKSEVKEFNTDSSSISASTENRNVKISLLQNKDTNVRVNTVDAAKVSSMVATNEKTGLQPRMWIESPENISYSGDVIVRGWALNPDGLTRLDIYLDIGANAQKAYSVNTFGTRTDVHNVIDPNGYYANSYNSGFNMIIPASDLTSGTHTVNVVAIGTGGIVQWSTRTFTVT
jgi:biopolymer transport protein ExbD